MATVTCETTLILDQRDAASILTEALCRYNAFADLWVESVQANATGDFVLTLTPRPTAEEERV